MHTRSSQRLASLLLVGALASGCDLLEDINKPPPPANQVPVLSGTVATPAEVSSGNTVALTLDASDPDGDALTYTWTQSPASPAGTFSDASAANPTWKAPEVAAETSFQLNIAVADGRGGNARGSAVVKVLPPSNNAVPVLTTGPSASVTTTDEQQTVTLSVTATDSDGDPLTYSWSQVSPASPTGSFSNAASASTTWTAPDVRTTGAYTLRVTVSDGKGGSVQGSVDISVRKINQAPVVPEISPLPALKAGDMVSLELAATDADGDPLTYSWTQTAPAEQGTWFSGREASVAKWYSPVLTSKTSFTFSVTVTDGESPAVTRTVTADVDVPAYSNVQAIWDDAPCTGCHNSPRLPGLNLTSTQSYGTLVNVGTQNGACNTLKRVEPRNPDNSSLVRKIEGTGCGTPMPQGNHEYFTRDNPNYLVRVRSWILAGANP
jgi:hypothetical protein